MLVPKGFKKTEVGVIPEEWSCTNLGSICNISKLAGFEYSKYFNSYNDGGEIIVIRGTNITNNVIDLTDIKTIPKKTSDFLKRSKLSKNDLVFAYVGTVGPTWLVDKDEKYHLGPNTARITPNDENCSRFISCYFKSNLIKREIDSALSIGAQPSLSMTKIRKFRILLPTFEEQQAITNALSDVDSLILSLEKLIAKKTAIKQGIMEELLTGKRRLNGVDEKWLNKKIGDIVYYQNGQSLEKYFDTNGKYKVISIGNYSLDSKFLDNGIRISNKYYEQIKKYIVGKNDLTMILNDKTSSGEIIGRAILIDSNDSYVINQRTIRLTLKDGVCPRYIYFAINSTNVRKSIFYMSKPGTQIYINTSDVLNITIQFPESVTEQTLIADILSDMDNEIEILQQKFDKYKQIKQGIMQELLTGRIRLTEASTQEITAPIEIKSIKQPLKKETHNPYFEDAVVIAAIVNAFYSDKFLLGRKKVQKLLYLLRRKQSASVEVFKKKAAGPYADVVRYKGGEPIALNKGYITATNSDMGTVFGIGTCFNEALEYVERWNMQNDIDWLLSQFKYTSVNKLEVLATIDMAMCNLKNEGIPISINSIKNLINSNKEWKAKLSKTYFSDIDIEMAISECEKLFG